ncbi:hypothetical protein like AT5G55570 [Hibiscus trionum]|uniref:Viral late gene transcription factor 3 zinc ribbon domain-containing protein n=1 Tax=Hibiscus trionum TaxID=183268 RepID=A0A9W7J9E1_HIBTR|nr:hypothetical protein like AT5G55570 [Hibiscus trionum]
MEVSLYAASSITSPVSIPQSKPTSTKFSNPTVSFLCTQRCNDLIGNNRRLKTKVAANLQDVSAVADPARVDITWQIVVGAIAGVTPFIVAGIEFSKRIIAQRRCEECGGSGLVFRDKDYFKCPECGGFLPWQSWKRFFTG